MNPFAARRAAFTLIELLVVIAIIAILASILFPVFGRARENGRRAACQSNLKQIGLGLTQYSQDYDEKLIADWYSTDTSPGDTYPQSSGTVGYKWMDAAYTYIKSEQVFTCPSATGDRAKPWVYYGKLGAVSKLYGSYVIMHGYGGPPRSCTACTPPVSHPQLGEVVNLSVAASPTTTAWVIDGADVAEDDNTTFYMQASSGADLTSVDDRHLDTTNVLFLDGHVKAMRTTALNARNAAGIISMATLEDD